MSRLVWWVPVVAVSAWGCQVPKMKLPATEQCPSGIIQVVDHGATVEIRCIAPSPGASPWTAPSPGPSPSPPPQGDPPPAAQTCPPAFDHPPTRVGLGQDPQQVRRIAPNRTRFLFAATPKDAPPFCPHRPGMAECEQWAPCAVAQARRGEGPTWWYAAYPGSQCTGPADCPVEHPSRSCDAPEEAEDVALAIEQGRDPDQARASCRRPNVFAGSDVVDTSGENGGPPGVRTLCVAPAGRPERAACRSWELTLQGARRIE